MSLTTPEHITSTRNTLWKVLPLQRVERKPILWDCDTAAVSPWQKTAFVVLAEGEGLQEEVSGRTEARGLSPELSLSSPPQCRSQIQQRGEGRGGGLPLRAKTARTLTNKWETKGVISITGATHHPPDASFQFFVFFFEPREGAVTSVSLFLHLPSQSFFISYTPSGQYVQLPKPLIAPLLYAHSPTHLKWQFMRSSLSLLKCFLHFFFFFQRLLHDNTLFFLSGQPWWISLPVLNIQFVSPVGEKKLFLLPHLFSGYQENGWVTFI